MADEEIKEVEHRQSLPIDLATERMPNRGSCGGCNYLFGLNDLCNEFLDKNKTVLELGVCDGVSTTLFAHHALRVVAVDRVYRGDMRKLVKRIKNIKFHRMMFKAFCKQCDEKFDLIYIDGRHQYKGVSEDLHHAVPLLKKGGVASGHDIDRHNGVRKAVRKHFPKAVIRTFSDSSWAVQL
jgi:predicted O-methyltransferase YrrM